MTVSRQVVIPQLAVASRGETWVHEALREAFGSALSPVYDGAGQQLAAWRLRTPGVNDVLIVVGEP